MKITPTIFLIRRSCITYQQKKVLVFFRKRQNNCVFLKLFKEIQRTYMMNNLILKIIVLILSESFFKISYGIFFETYLWVGVKNISKYFRKPHWNVRLLEFGDKINFCNKACRSHILIKLSISQATPSRFLEINKAPKTSVSEWQ